MKDSKQDTENMLRAENNAEEDCAEKLIEWQDYQDDTGHYADDKMPHRLTYPGKPHIFGYILIVSSIFYTIPVFVSVFINRSENALELINNFGGIVFISLAASVQIAAGIRIVKKYK